MLDNGDLVKSKSDSHNPEEEASVVLPGRHFSLKSVSREDVHLTQFWSILTKQSRGSGLCLFWPATTAVSWSDFQASHWSPGPRECLSLAAEDTGKL